jgi:hypothetical protein
MTKRKMERVDQENSSEPTPHQLLLNFLRDLQRHPQDYDVNILADDPELAAAYKEGRAQLLALIEQLESF